MKNSYVLNTNRLIHIVFIFMFFLNKIFLAQTFPPGFSKIRIAEIDEASAMAFAPDGRIFVCQKSGAVRVIKNGALLAAPFITLTVDINGERGIGGIAFDPDFNLNHYVYIYYTAVTPTIHNRLSRFTANGDVVLPGSEFPLLDAETVNSVYHNGGGLAFGPDGKLYLAMGEDNSPNNAQNLSTYKGKLLRLNPDGTAPADNPYSNSASQVTKKIWSLGLRNPYTLAFQPGIGKLFVNNVGAENWEEIHDATLPGKNFGWPIVEGNSSNPNYDNPVFAYPHESTGQNGCAITGGTFFNPASTNYPSQYIGNYFYMDYCDGWMYNLTLGSTITNAFFSSGMVTQNLALQVGPDGNLYYLNRFESKAGVYKIIYTSNNAPAISSHPASLNVIEGQPAAFSVSATGAPTLNYQWKKNSIDITNANSSTYNIPNTLKADSGQYSVLVSNTYGNVLSNPATLTVEDYNAPPDVTIITPANEAYFRAGDVINFSGSATDLEDGILPASAFEWTVEFWHNNNHFHPGPVIPPGIINGSFTTSNTDHTSANIFYRLKLKVTDSNGLIDTTHVDILPATSTITINSEPSGLQITFDSQPFTTPFTTLTVEGLLIHIGVVSPQNKNGQGYAFDYWKDGGNATQTIKIGVGDSSYTAVFKDTLMVCTATGTILHEYWENIIGDNIASIPVNTPPSSISQLSLLEASSNMGDNYGARIRGYICAPATGNYTFWIASDNNSELWLSTNNNPANKQKIASVNWWTTSRQWTKFPSQQSAPIYLLAGGKYYIEVLHKESTEADHIAVGWQLPDTSMERPIPGSRLSPSPTICETPQGLTTNSVTASSATISWIEIVGATSYEIQYRETNTTAWSTSTSPTNSKVLSGLMASTMHEYQAKAICGTLAGNFSAIEMFTTLPPSVFSSQNLTICSGETITVGIYTYTASGTYTDILTAVNGADSIVTTNLTINDPIFFSQNLIICLGQKINVGNKTYSISGIYIDTLKNSTNCDSIVTTNLTVSPSIDNSVTITGSTITANMAGGSYQWIDCGKGNSIIIGETNQSFTASASGNYAVIITNNSCSDTSACSSIVINGMPNISQATNLSVFPNPTDNIIYISYISDEAYGSLILKVKNELGQLIYSSDISSFKEEYKKTIDLSDQAKGIYYLEVIINDKERYVKKVVKK